MNLEVLVLISALPLYQQAEGWKDLHYCPYKGYVFIPNSRINE